jgi:hypothetical protein
VQIDGNDAVVLIDSNATGNMLSPLFANLAGILTDLSDPGISITVTDGMERLCAGSVKAVPLRMRKKGQTIKVTSDFSSQKWHSPKVSTASLICHGFRGGDRWSMNHRCQL